MTVANTNVLNYLGKYVSFNNEYNFEIYGVISNVIFYINGDVDIFIGWDDSYKYSEITNLKILGEVKLY